MTQTRVTRRCPFPMCRHHFNEKLEKMVLNHNYYSYPSILLSVIDHYTPNLTYLSHDEYERIDVFSRLAKLKFLQTLSINLSLTHMDPFLQLLISQKTPIKHLKIKNGNFTCESVKTLSQMNQILTLDVTSPKNLSKKHIFKIVIKLIQLKTLRLPRSLSFNTDDLYKLIKSNPSLAYVRVHMDSSSRLENEFFFQILNLIKKYSDINLNIDILSKGKILYVDDKILIENQDKLNIINH